ncbi:MAG: type II secretion system F family protein [Micromonosporaceae bacterium]
MTLLVGLLVVCALLLAWSPGGGGIARPRLRRVVVTERRARSLFRGRVDVIRGAAAIAGLSAGVVIGGWFGLACGIGVGCGLDHALRRLEPRAARRARLAAAAELPFAVDLLAASMQAGSPPAVALRAVGAILGGPLGERLCRVAQELSLGASAAHAWAHLHGVPGAARVITVAVRSSQSGAALAGAMARVVDELRTARGLACEAAARRSGVLTVLPLGLCFLPAFVLAGLVPVVLGVLAEVMP